MSWGHSSVEKGSATTAKGFRLPEPRCVRGSESGEQ